MLNRTVFEALPEKQLQQQKSYQDVYDKSAQFVANLIIERQAELPETAPFAFTSNQAFESFALKFQGDRPSPKQKETVDILHNSVFVVDTPVINKLSLDDSVLVICDILYSHQNGLVILVSDIPKKRDKATEFYRKKDPKAEIPYPIYNVSEAEFYLRGRFVELSKLVDMRIAKSFVQKPL